MRSKLKEQPKSISHIILISLIVIGLTVIAMQIYVKITDMRLQKNAVRATAIIVDIETQTNPMRENLTQDAFHHKYTYKYIVNGAEYFKTFQSGGNLNPYYRIGDEVQIYYAENSPQDAHTQGETDYWLPLTLLSANMVFWVSRALFRSTQKRTLKQKSERAAR